MSRCNTGLSFLPLFSLLFLHIFHIISHFFHIFNIISQFSSVFPKSFHYSTYFSSIFSVSFHILSIFYAKIITENCLCFGCWIVILDIRHYYWMNDKRHPSSHGVSLDFDQYQKLKDVDRVLPDIVSDLKKTLPCQVTHQNVDSAMYCSECNPCCI
jgi:hypothetical protein